MPIHKPDRVLLHHIPLKFVASKVSGGGRKGVDAAIPLVPFIDFLITLVVFLLSSFSASGELMSQRPNLVMPGATNADELELSPIVAIDARVVTLEGRQVADTNTLQATAGMERIEPLIQDLETMRRNWSVLHPRDPFPAAIIVQADRMIDFRIIKKVMFSAAQAGYTSVSFAVNRTGGE